MIKTRDNFEAAPIRTTTRTVPKEWIDYNGHMNVAYYTMAIDQAMDEVFDMLGLGQDLVAQHGMGPMALQGQIHYLDELLMDQTFACDIQLLDADYKRMHLFVTMLHLDNGTEAATWEAISMNVDLTARRSTGYPTECLARVDSLLKAHSDLPRHRLAGASLGLKRKKS
ncbi:MAG: thioesterase family protein [Pseudomonadota bacterium]